MILLKSPGF